MIPQGGHFKECKQCKGISIYLRQLLPPSPCTICHGAGQQDVPNGQHYALVCTECRGTGETEMFNPLMLKGVLKK